MRTKKFQNTVFCGMFAAILAVMSQIRVPMPSGMPFTLQTYAVSLIGFLLGAKYGCITVGIYILLGIFGVPVFSGFAGGPGAVVGTTGGFIWGFLFLVSGCGLAGKGTGDKCQFHIVWKKLLKVLGPFVGLAVCHLLGTLQFSLVTKMGIREAVLLVSVPYVVKDVLSLLGGFWTMKAIRKRTDLF